MSSQSPYGPGTPSRDWDRRGLPGWTYHSDAFRELEAARLLLNHWQIACQVSDVPQPGDYTTFDLVDDRALIVRGNDGMVRAFHNLCRHRGSRVVSAKRGRCPGRIVCPFHGWVYDLDGRLKGPTRAETFGNLDTAGLGLKPIESEIWNGLVFVRFAPGPQPSVAETMAAHTAELAPYQIDRVVPAEPAWTQTLPINWKSVRDVDNEGYHVARAHPALQELYGHSYRDGPFIDWVCRSAAEARTEGGRRWSVQRYVQLTEPCTELPPEQRRAWLYYTLFPNTVIAVTPELVQYYAEFPLATDRTLLRGAVYRHADETRRQRLARYLAMRIDRETMAEDVQLSIWSNDAMKSSAFDDFILSDLEYALRTHHDLVRRNIPQAKLRDYPGEPALRSGPTGD